jgi:hypothetical protein
MIWDGFEGNQWTLCHQVEFNASHDHVAVMILLDLNNEMI